MMNTKIKLFLNEVKKKFCLFGVNSEIWLLNSDDLLSIFLNLATSQGSKTRKSPFAVSPIKFKWYGISCFLSIYSIVVAAT